ncbi:MAG: ArnT family glycosyltransferase [Gemmatimonadales bacterium]
MLGSIAVNDASSATAARAAWWLGLAVVWVIGSLYLWHFLDRGWIPHDDGTLAHSAERVLHGELPHRDFAEVYTGGLSYLNALAFRLFGIHLLTIRYVLFAAFMLWVPALYYAASRLAPPFAASVVTLLGVFWSVPNYPAAMPSWYNLFFATFGLAALFAYIEAPRRCWLVLAGLAGGLSVLCKVSGLFFVGAGVLLLVYREARQPAADSVPGSRRPAFQLVAGIPLLAAAAALLAIGASRRSWEDLYQFALPGLAIVAVVAAAVLRSRGDSSARATRLVGTLGWYLLGVLVPVTAFVAVYAASDAVPELLRGTFVLPMRRFDYGAALPGSPLKAWPTLGMALLLVGGTWLPRRLAAVYHGIALGILAVALMWAPHVRVHDLIWASLAQATPLVIVALAALLGRPRSYQEHSPARQSQCVLVAAAAALCALVQYPFAHPVYFCYVAPLVLLALIPVIQSLPGRKQPALAAIAGMYLVFGALYLVPFRFEGLAASLRKEDLAVLELPRGRLRIGQEQARGYHEAIELLRAHATSGVVYAGPDAPEIYFLANLHNPTPAIFDFLVPDSLFHRRLAEGLDRSGISAVALKHGFIHSAPLEAEVVAAFERRFPSATRAGRFTIRWAP